MLDLTLSPPDQTPQLWLNCLENNPNKTRYLVQKNNGDVYVACHHESQKCLCLWFLLIPNFPKELRGEGNSQIELKWPCFWSPKMGTRIEFEPTWNVSCPLNLCNPVTEHLLLPFH